MFVILGVIALFTAGGVYLTERVDRPRRRALRQAQQLPAE